MKYGVAVELFLFPTSYADVATLGSFASTTGGELHYYKNYVVSSGRGSLGVAVYELNISHGELQL